MARGTAWANVRMEGEVLKGEAYDPMNEQWLPFELDLASGEVVGGSYPPELP